MVLTSTIMPTTIISLWAVGTKLRQQILFLRLTQNLQTIAHQPTITTNPQLVTRILPLQAINSLNNRAIPIKLIQTITNSPQITTTIQLIPSSKTMGFHILILLGEESKQIPSKLQLFLPMVLI